MGWKGKMTFWGGEKGTCFWPVAHAGLGLYKSLQEKACFQKTREGTQDPKHKNIQNALYNVLHWKEHFEQT